MAPLHAACWVGLRAAPGREGLAVFGHSTTPQQLINNRFELLELVAEGSTRALPSSAVAESVRKLIPQGQNTAVVISADRSVKYERVVKVMDTLQRAGIERVGLSVQLTP